MNSYFFDPRRHPVTATGDGTSHKTQTLRAHPFFRPRQGQYGRMRTWDCAGRKR